MAEPLVCYVTRASGRTPPTDVCDERSFEREFVSGNVQRFSLWTQSFVSADAFLTWLEKTGQIVLSPADMDNVTALDGGPLPAWSVEIYDDYRE